MLRNQVLTPNTCTYTYVCIYINIFHIFIQIILDSTSTHVYVYINIHAPHTQSPFRLFGPNFAPGGLIESIASVGFGSGAPCSSPPSRHKRGTAAGRRSRFGYVLGAFETSFQVANSQVGIRCDVTKTDVGRRLA